MVLGEEAFAFGDSNQWAAEALDIDRVVNDAVAENSLNPQNIEMAIRQSLLPRLFAVMGLEKAKDVIERVIQVTRIGLSRGSI
jgi:type I restriction enzyme R subunit